MFLDNICGVVPGLEDVIGCKEYKLVKSTLVDYLNCIIDTSHHHKEQV